MCAHARLCVRVPFSSFCCVSVSFKNHHLRLGVMPGGWVFSEGGISR